MKSKIETTCTLKTYTAALFEDTTDDNKDVEINVFKFRKFLRGILENCI
jgi:hypothetical protein